MSEDWRLEFFTFATVFARRKPCTPTVRACSPGWEHDHCVACWTKLAEPHVSGEDVVHKGYATTSDFVRGREYEWVCVQCFEQFKEHMACIDVTLKVSDWPATA
jgi:hypothetical protein